MIKPWKDCNRVERFVIVVLSVFIAVGIITTAIDLIALFRNKP